ncbi:hypothetical protein D3C85_806760 [compost metagenome]
MDKTIVTKDLDNKTLRIERLFDAPKETVWKFYAEKEWFEKWWGPEGWETTAKVFNFTPGGHVHYEMKCVDELQTEWFGQSSWGAMVIESIDAPNNFVYKDYFSDETGVLNSEMPSLKVENSFIEEGSQTRLVIVSHADSVEQIEQLLDMGMVEGFSSQMNKLDALIETT